MTTILFMVHVHVIQTCGLPHSDIWGSWDVGSSPQLFAANRVLLRLTAPRHPPWTLFRLTILSFRFHSLLIFKNLLLALGSIPIALGGMGT